MPRGKNWVVGARSAPLRFVYAGGRIATVVGKNDGQRAKTSRKITRERVPPLQNSKNPYAKWAAKPPTFGALLLNFGGVERARA